MSKVDEMRRMREAQHAAREAREQGAPQPAAAAVVERPRGPVRTSKAKADAVEGKCAACGKLRALQNGLVSNHQKGFGKMCPGSRKAPA